MSYRELQKFCEMMRSLGYPRTISMENFREPNFKLVSEIIYWLALRLDRKADIPSDIEDEKARVEFIKSAGIFFYNNLNDNNNKNNNINENNVIDNQNGKNDNNINNEYSKK